MLDSNATTPRKQTVRLVLLSFFLGLGYLVSVAFDRPLFEAFSGFESENEDWHRLLRVMGYVPTWIVVAVVFALIDWPKVKRMGWFRAMWRPGLLLMAVIIAGVMAELLKILIRRERPGMHDGAYVMRSYLEDPFYSGGLSSPSSHSAVAFAAGFMMMHLVPRAGWVWLILAFGCAMTRIMAQAHFVSDTYLAAVVSWAVVHLLWQQHLKNNPQLNQSSRVLFEPLR